MQWCHMAEDEHVSISECDVGIHWSDGINNLQILSKLSYAVKTYFFILKSYYFLRILDCFYCSVLKFLFEHK